MSTSVTNDMTSSSTMAGGGAASTAVSSTATGGAGDDAAALEANLIDGSRSRGGGGSASGRGDGGASALGGGAGAREGFCHSILDALVHTVYPVVVAPFFVGIFYMVAAWRLAAPSMATGCLTRVFMNPSRRSGPLLFTFTGGLFRACPSGSRNPDNALVLFIIGLSLLLALVAPIFNISMSSDERDVVPGDSALVSATVVGYILCSYLFLWIGLKFSILARSEKAMERSTLDANQHTRSVVQKRRDALSYLADKVPDLELDTTPLWIVLVGIATSFVECVMFKIFSQNFEGAAARFRNLNDQWSALTYATAFFLLTSTNTMAWFGFYHLYAQLHRLTQFEACAKLSNDDSATAGAKKDATVARWSVAWQHLLLDMERQPMVCSVAPACSALLFIEVTASMMFGALHILFTNQAFHDLLPIALFVGMHSLILLSLYLVVIVRTQHVIDRQHKAISTLQNEVQMEVDAAADNDQIDEMSLDVMRAKVRVLQSLDRFLVVADPRPKILNNSLEAFRWSIINFSLILICITFLLLYLVFCYAKIKEKAAKKAGK